MAVTLVAATGAVQCYFGVAADTKPTTGVQTCALFFETDTGAWWTYTGSVWAHYGDPVRDGGPAVATSFGVSGATFTSSDQHSAAAAVTDAPTSGQKLVIADIEVSVDTAMTVTFTEETSGTVVCKGYFSPNNGISQLTPRAKRKLATANKRLMLQTSMAGNIAVTAFFYSEA